MTVSHEIRSPLHAIATAAALLADSPLNDEQRELVQMLDSGASHVVVIIEDLLSLRALQSGNFRVRKSLLPGPTVCCSRVCDGYGRRNSQGFCGVSPDVAMIKSASARPVCRAGALGAG